VALVTGAASGIGRASAMAFAAHGASEVVADVADESGRETVDMIEAAGGDAISIPADVSRAQDVDRLMARAVETYGRVDYAHNNAGIEGNAPPGTAFHDYPEAVWDQVISINLKGVWLCMKAALEYATRSIRVNAVCPGGIRTPMLDRVFARRPELEAAFIAGEPVGRLGTPEEIAAVAVWLCSEDASFLTGVALPVDGGWLAR
jgi:NAD(P)-dependent dehydrogenase (short-subunit alcohol dehydrogenase family)